MCGFFAVFNNNKILNKKKIMESSKLISHRGPDDSSNFLDNNFYGIFYRLSIQDLSLNGRQPMLSKCKNYLILFNGEIYNKDECRNKIANNLKGSSDTEVILNLFLKYNINFTKYIQGMYAILIYDLNKKKIFIFRDPYGIKPVYYAINNNNIVISSEIKPILNFIKKKSLNYKSTLDFFFKQQMDHWDNTFFEGVKALPPGNYLTYKKSVAVKKFANFPKQSMSDNQNIAEINLKKYFEESIKKHLLSDVKISLMVSGGTDSNSLFKAISKNLNYDPDCYTYFFKNYKSSEYYNLKKLKIKNIHEFEVTPNVIAKNINKVIEIVESPLTSIRQIADYEIYKMASKKNKVILVGHGGDEIFAGYDQNIIRMIIKKGSIYKKINNLLKFINKRKKPKERQEYLTNIIMNLSYQNLSTKDCDSYFNIDLFNKDFLNSNLDEKYFKDKHFKNFDIVKKSQLRDIFEISLPRNLKYCDRLSMAHGLEARVPFLDLNFSNYSLNLNDNLKYKKDISRWIFKKINKKLNLPKYKSSVPDPQSLWLKKYFFNDIYKTFKSIDEKKLNIFNKKDLINYLKLYKKKKKFNSFLIFQIYSFCKFYEKFFN